ncbi:uncharacterized protein EV422DRAFT_617230 [Fimicolochytrium jonesii]|uniref:uncharacterized protein n=1 Tax=Fimicolochytrium jonesii TaxID=1396493 RepID=UPI0022FE05EB|nr:uncharacterized protein EV422DRAFT_617230 [Fimicolochytrium jonesii]KAI8826258.1 hypothetical protein EV422DRAFT_617230 [Fimicolochytrium jonesii]
MTRETPTPTLHHTSFPGISPILPNELTSLYAGSIPPLHRRARSAYVRPPRSTFDGDALGNEAALAIDAAGFVGPIETYGFRQVGRGYVDGSSGYGVAEKDDRPRTAAPIPFSSDVNLRERRIATATSTSQPTPMGLSGSKYDLCKRPPTAPPPFVTVSSPSLYVEAHKSATSQSLFDIPSSRSDNRRLPADRERRRKNTAKHTSSPSPHSPYPPSSADESDNNSNSDDGPAHASELVRPPPATLATPTPLLTDTFFDDISGWHSSDEDAATTHAFSGAAYQYLRFDTPNDGHNRDADASPAPGPDVVRRLRREVGKRGKRKVPGKVVKKEDGGLSRAQRRSRRRSGGGGEEDEEERGGVERPVLDTGTTTALNTIAAITTQKTGTPPPPSADPSPIPTPPPPRRPKTTLGRPPPTSLLEPIPIPISSPSLLTPRLPPASLTATRPPTTTGKKFARPPRLPVPQPVVDALVPDVMARMRRRLQSSARPAGRRGGSVSQLLPPAAETVAGLIPATVGSHPSASIPSAAALAIEGAVVMGTRYSAKGVSGAGNTASLTMTTSPAATTTTTAARITSAHSSPRESTTSTSLTVPAQPTWPRPKTAGSALMSVPVPVASKSEALFPLIHPPATVQSGAGSIPQRRDHLAMRPHTAAPGAGGVGRSQSAPNVNGGGEPTVEAPTKPKCSASSTSSAIAPPPQPQQQTPPPGHPYSILHPPAPRSPPTLPKWFAAPPSPRHRHHHSHPTLTTLPSSNMMNPTHQQYRSATLDKFAAALGGRAPVSASMLAITSPTTPTTPLMPGPTGVHVVRRAGGGRRLVRNGEPFEVEDMRVLALTSGGGGGGVAGGESGAGMVGRGAPIRSFRESVCGGRTAGARAFVT